MSNAYLNKQKAAHNAVFDTAQELVTQFCVDVFTIILHNREHYGHGRMLEVRAEFEELRKKYSVCFDTKHPEADYYRELLDREMRAVHGDEANKFEDRYPMAREILYDKPVKTEKTVRPKKRKKKH